MENTQTETKTQAAPAQPPVTEKPVAAAPVAAPVAVAEKPQTAAPVTEKPGPKDFFKQRDDRREKKATERVAELEKKLAELESAKTPKEAEPAPVSFLDNPDEWAKNERERMKTEVFSELERRQSESKVQAEFRQASESAAEWLLTRSHLKEDKAFLNDVAVLVEDKYSHVAAVDPSAAAELAYIYACKAKGITPDIEGLVSAGMDATKGAASSGVRQSAPATGKRVFARGEGEKYINQAKPGSAEYSARINEVEEAHREGRIK